MVGLGWKGGGKEPCEGVHVGAPAADAAGAHAFALAGGEGFVCDGVAMDCVDECDVDVGNGAGENQGIAVVGPLGEVDGEDFLKLWQRSAAAQLRKRMVDIHQEWSLRHVL